MTDIRVVLVIVLGVLLALSLGYLYWRAMSRAGEFIITRDDEGRYSYVLSLEEEPEGLHKRRYIFFKVKKSH